MAKYKLKALSVHLGGIVHKIEEGIIFDTEKKFKNIKKEVEAAAKAGFLVKLSAKETKEEAKLAELKAKEKELAEKEAAELIEIEAKAKAEAEELAKADAKIEVEKLAKANKNKK